MSVDCVQVMLRWIIFVFLSLFHGYFGSCDVAMLRNMYDLDAVSKKIEDLIEESLKVKTFQVRSLIDDDVFFFF